MTKKPALVVAEVEGFLQHLHDSTGEAVTNVEPLDGGYWSTAFGYRAGDRDLVLRVGSIVEGFEMDRAAAAFRRPGLPIPAVLDIGTGLGASYAVSERHYGRFLESVRPDEAAAVGPTIVDLLWSLLAVPAPAGAGADWFRHPDSTDSTWRGWLAGGLEDDPGHPASGWRAVVADDADLDRLFVACERGVRRLLDACPERRDLVHGDLLHGNVLVDDRAATVTGLFSWKCSVRGDFLFDVALCTFWAPWYEGIAATDVWQQVTGDPRLAAEPDLLRDAADRHHCYELQLAASHLGWTAWTGQHDVLDKLRAHAAMVLERGPLPLP